MAQDRDQTLAAPESSQTQQPARRSLKTVKRGGVGGLPKKIREELERRLDSLVREGSRDA